MKGCNLNKKRIALDVCNVSVRYRGLTNVSIANSLKRKAKKETNLVNAVNNISFSVEEGEIIGIVGRNGSGKTTLLRTIAGIFQPDEGHIDKHGNRVSLMAIGVGFNPNNTGRENIIKSGLLLGCTLTQINDSMNEIIEFSELGDFIDKPVRTYSSGMYSKLAFSITAILDTDIMLVDEVLSVGDEHFRKKSFKKMEELIHSNRTVIIVSHATDTLRKFCNKILWLNNGQFICLGDTEDVLLKYEQSMQL